MRGAAGAPTCSASIPDRVHEALAGARAPTTRASIPDRVHEALAGEPALVLAVSGGLDSMVLLHAAVQAGLAPRIASVATFDHASGAAATAAAEFVARAAAAHGLPCDRARAPDGGPRTEAAWRDQRRAFLRDVAHRRAARLVTAHTRDDHIETVAMRIVRGSGARGLAGLAAVSDVRRPLLDTTRAELDAWARANRVAFVTDPTNTDRQYFRNRMRLDLLPALRRAVPAFDAWILDLAQRASALRRAVEAVAEQVPVSIDPGGGAIVDRGALRGLAAADLATLWPALAARASLTLDRRGTERLARFTETGSTGGRVQLSGKVEVVLRRDAFVIGPLGPPRPSRRKRSR